MKKITPPSVWHNPIHFIAFGFGSGALPVAPGTWGTLVALPLYALLIQFGWFTYLWVTLLATGFGIWLCGKTSKDIGVHDHPGIVWDEIVGYLVTMFLVPVGWLWALLGFGLFRFFDILKPWPIKAIDRQVKGGFGIMLDDILAGVYAWLILQTLAWLLA